MKTKLTFQLIFYILLSSLVITLVITAVQLYFDYKQEIAAIEEQRLQVETSYLPTLINQLWVGDFSILQLQLDGISRLPYVRYVALDHKDGPSITAGTFEYTAALSYEFPMNHKYQDHLFALGTLKLNMDLDLVYERLFDKLFLILGNQAAIIFLVSVFVFFIFQQTVMRHLLSIAHYTRSTGIDNLETPLLLERKSAVPKKDELEDVVNGINAMRTNLLSETQKITSLNQAFAKFVPQDFLKHLDKNSITDVRLGDSVQRTMSVLFSDLRSFTKLSEGMTPQDNFRFLNAYLGLMSPVIQKHGGFVDKYIGDAIMALFDRSADDALLAGAAMLKELQTYNLTRNRPERPTIRMGLGIHTGQLMLGTIGEHNRMETTVISDAVNIASRLEGMTKMYGVQMLISDATLAQLQHPEQFHTRIVDRVQAKGKSEPITILEVFNSDPAEIFDKKSSTMKGFQEGLALYHLKEFEEAQHHFKTCLRQFPEDKAAEIYVKRCQQLLKLGWDDDWDGVTQLDSK